MVDGSTRLGAFVRILLPLVAPGLVATSVFAFILSWNEYIFATTLLHDGEDTDDHRLALVPLRREPVRRLGPDHGRLDVDRDPSRDLFPPRPAPDRIRPYRGRRESVNW
jgi:hypothetical protein